MKQSKHFKQINLLYNNKSENKLFFLYVNYIIKTKIETTIYK